MSAHHDHHQQDVPRGILIAAGLMIAFTIALVGAARLELLPEVERPAVDEVVSRDIQFQDSADGSISVVDASAGKEIDRLEPGTNGFLRATVRGLATERKQLGLGSEAPFRLTYWEDGSLSLDDLATGQRVNLEAFGPTNAGVFAALLGYREAAQ